VESGSKNTILIVDDEKINLLALNKILSPEYAISLAKSGKLALRLVEENRPDLILLDVLMPDMNGFEVLAKLKESENTAHIPVIFITGLDGEQNEEKGLLLGAADYIKKPFKDTIVKARVNTHMQIVRQMYAIEKLGNTDPLTELPNRRAFGEHMEAEWKRAVREKTPVAFLMMDIDKFKAYNDAYGHPQGDTLLKAAAKIFMSAARRPGDFAARLGGEEFGLLLPNTDLENALIVAERVRSGMEAARIPTADGNNMTTATISIGVMSFIPKLKDTIEDFINQADKNLYTAKETGRNRVYAGESKKFCA
jgi:diguanylate cyclase (GGDEF)-like protein